MSEIQQKNQLNEEEQNKIALEKKQKRLSNLLQISNGTAIMFDVMAVTTGFLALAFPASAIALAVAAAAGGGASLFFGGIAHYFGHTIKEEAKNFNAGSASEFDHIDREGFFVDPKDLSGLEEKEAEKITRYSNITALGTYGAVTSDAAAFVVGVCAVFFPHVAVTLAVLAGVGGFISATSGVTATVFGFKLDKAIADANEQSKQTKLNLEKEKALLAEEAYSLEHNQEKTEPLQKEKKNYRDMFTLNRPGSMVKKLEDRLKYAASSGESSRTA